MVGIAVCRRQRICWTPFTHLLCHLLCGQLFEHVSVEGLGVLTLLLRLLQFGLRVVGRLIVSVCAHICVLAILLVIVCGINTSKTVDTHA